MLKHPDFEIDRSKKSLDMLLIDRKNEFRELASVVKISTSTKDWEEFILKLCLDVSDVFNAWSGREEIISLQTANKTLTLLRQLSKGKSSMIEVTHLLNIAYTLAEEFKAVYKRIE
ncbi:MAG: hypothetical protein WD154_05800 [Nitrosopumilaceae archaeon]